MNLETDVDSSCSFDIVSNFDANAHKSHIRLKRNMRFYIEIKRVHRSFIISDRKSIHNNTYKNMTNNLH